MLKKMRLRVILSAIFAFFSVIFLIAVLVNVINYGIVTRQADMTLDFISEVEGSPPDEINIWDEEDPSAADDPPAGGNLMPGEELMAGGNPPVGVDPPGFDAAGNVPRSFGFSLPDPEASYTTRFFVVEIDSDGNIESAGMDNIASVDETEAAEYAAKAMKCRSDRGYLGTYRYLRTKYEDNSTQIVFLNTAQRQAFQRMLLVISLFVSLVSLLIVSLLVIIFSGQAIKPLAKNIESQKRFITDASHELKTPLTSIMTSLDVLELSYGNDEWTENIRNQTGRMSKLVKELVALSRLDEEHPLPNKESFSISNTAWEIIEVYQERIMAQGKNLEVNIREDISMVGEKAAIQQMLSVLLDNAIRYSTGDGDIHFSVSKERNRVKIEVSNTCDYDTGVDVDRLFDRFYRPDHSRNVNLGGNGIGLAIAKAVTEAHGGTIKASCPTGKKMTMKVVI